MGRFDPEWLESVVSDCTQAAISESIRDAKYADMTPDTLASLVLAGVNRMREEAPRSRDGLMGYDIMVDMALLIAAALWAYHRRFGKAAFPATVENIQQVLLLHEWSLFWEIQLWTRDDHVTGPLDMLRAMAMRLAGEARRRDEPRGPTEPPYEERGDGHLERHMRQLLQGLLAVCHSANIERASLMAKADTIARGCRQAIAEGRTTVMLTLLGEFAPGVSYLIAGGLTGTVGGRDEGGRPLVSVEAAHLAQYCEHHLALDDVPFALYDIHAIAFVSGHAIPIHP